MHISFTVAGEPVAKGRPRVTKSHTYTPQKTVNFENLVKYEYIRQCNGLKFSNDAQIALDVVAYRSIPKNTSQKKRKLMGAGVVLPLTRPDWDNIGKIISDSLNGLAYKDDSQVVDARVRKIYSSEPRTEVRLWEV